MPLKGGKGRESKVGEAPSAEVNGLQTRSAKAGLQVLIGNNNFRIGAKATVYTSTILAYLTAEVLELAGPSRAPLYASRDRGNASNDLCFKRVTPRDLQFAIRDEELTRSYE
ncbi:hypothetical protein EDB86DRAFT_3101550 [Lactarius hatsudake]|nr:hypothetical protein EDB86DRAFT_3101550 [Lactarius hatsudake]